MFHVVRWIFVIPGAVISFIVAFTVVYWVTTLILMFTSVPEELVRIYPAGVAGGAGFVLGGVWIAPTYRGATSLVLLILNVAFGTAFLVFFMIGLLGDAEPRPTWHVVTEYVGTLVGSGFALYLVISQLGWDRDTEMSEVWIALRR